MQDKTSIVETAASQVGLCINKKKTKPMKINAKRTSSTRERGGSIIVEITLGAQQDIKRRIGKVRTAFNFLNKVLRSKDISTTPIDFPIQREVHVVLS